jgi:hypothetical protein
VDGRLPCLSEDKSAQAAGCGDEWSIGQPIKKMSVEEVEENAKAVMS